MSYLQSSNVKKAKLKAGKGRNCNVLWKSIQIWYQSDGVYRPKYKKCTEVRRDEGTTWDITKTTLVSIPVWYEFVDRCISSHCRSSASISRSLQWNYWFIKKHEQSGNIAQKDFRHGVQESAEKVSFNIAVVKDENLIICGLCILECRWFTTENHNARLVLQ